MKNYKRMTKKAQEVFNYGEFYNKNIVDKDDVVAYCADYDWCHGGNAIDRLAELEDKIERGELIERTSEECSAVRKQAVEECLRILRNIRLQLPRHFGVFWEGWSGAFNAAIRAISQKYAVSVEEECGE